MIGIASRRIEVGSRAAELIMYSETRLQTAVVSVSGIKFARTKKRKTKVCTASNRSTCK